MGGRNYNLRMGLPEASGFPSFEDIRIAEAIIRQRCEAGEHRTETDPDTGDEVCRHCGTNTTAGSPDGR